MSLRKFLDPKNTNPEDVREIIGKDTILEKAYKALNQFYWSEKEVIAYEAELKRKRDEVAVYDQKILEGEIIGEANGRSPTRKATDCQTASCPRR